MKRPLHLLAAFALAATANAQIAGLEAHPSTRSVSGQFIVHGVTVSTGDSRITRLTQDPNYFQVDPALLTVSCERIKEILWRTLDDKSDWRGKVFFNVHPARSADENVRIVSEKFADGWQYRVDLPDVMERARFVRVVVQVLLMENINRGSQWRSIEIPLWFIEGLARELCAADENGIVLRPPNARVSGVTMRLGQALNIDLGAPSPNADAVAIRPLNVNERQTNHLARAWEILSVRAPLTFDQLSWPSDDELTGGAGELYQYSAQLFVDRLLSLRDGRNCLREMMAALPKHMNWQLAFLAGFKPHFGRMLDVEKWWAVQVAEFTGRNLTQMWSPSDSLDKLDDIIHSSAQVRTDRKELPMRAEVNLQALLRSSNGIQQTEFYRQKLHELDSLRVRVAQEVIGLVDEYREAIAAYLRRQGTTTPFLPLGKQGRLVVNSGADELARRLDTLDLQRRALHESLQKIKASPLENSATAFRE